MEKFFFTKISYSVYKDTRKSLHKYLVFLVLRVQLDSKNFIGVFTKKKSEKVLRKIGWESIK